MAKDTRQAFLRELDRLWPGLARAFVAAIRDVRSNIAIKGLEEAIAAGDIEAAFAALRMDKGLMSPPTEALAAAYLSEGKRLTASVVAQTRRLPVGARVIAGFDVGNPVAAEWVREAGAKLITEVIDDTRDMVAETVARGLEAGRNPRGVALDIAGRMEGKRRKGGLVGLHSRQAEWVQNLRDELSDPDAMGGYFSRKRRDKRFDALVKRAQRQGRAVAPKDIDRIAGRYADRLLNLRGEMIARTETLTAMHAARDEALRQMVADEKIDADAIKLVWDATGDARTRPSHAAADGQKVGFGEPFMVGGYQMKHPGDASLGAPGSETIGCRCFKGVEIDVTRRLSGQ